MRIRGLVLNVEVPREVGGNKARVQKLSVIDASCVGSPLLTVQFWLKPSDLPLAVDVSDIVEADVNRVAPDKYATPSGVSFTVSHITVVSKGAGSAVLGISPGVENGKR